MTDDPQKLKSKWWNITRLLWHPANQSPALGDWKSVVNLEYIRSMSNRLVCNQNWSYAPFQYWLIINQIIHSLKLISLLHLLISHPLNPIPYLPRPSWNGLSPQWDLHQGFPRHIPAFGWLMCLWDISVILFTLSIISIVCRINFKPVPQVGWSVFLEL